MPSLADVLHDEVDQLESLVDLATAAVDNSRGAIRQSVNDGLARIADGSPEEIAAQVLAVFQDALVDAGIVAAADLVDVTTDAFEAGVRMAQLRRRAG
jgi:hypothetical protein